MRKNMYVLKLDLDELEFFQFLVGKQIQDYYRDFQFVTRPDYKLWVRNRIKNCEDLQKKLNKLKEKSKYGI